MKLTELFGICVLSNGPVPDVNCFGAVEVPNVNGCDVDAVLNGFGACAIVVRGHVNVGKDVLEVAVEDTGCVFVK